MTQAPRRLRALCNSAFHRHCLMCPPEDQEAPYAPFESYGTFNEFSRVVTKHVLGGQERFNELKQRLKMCEHANSKAGAAALGYLIAMEEKENGKETIYDLVLEQVEDNADSMNRTDAIFTVIYKWLDKKLEGAGYYNEGSSRSVLREAFEPYMPCKSVKSVYGGLL